MAPYVPEEVDVFTVPHSRMKELVSNYYSMLQTTNFTNMVDLQQLLEALSRTFKEFKTHEQIENKYIMKRLKTKLKRLSIKNTAVCNCHKDNALTDMLDLVKDGYRKKTDTDRLNYGLKLKKALEEFTSTFLPHMKEEEEVFQPLLLQYFTYEEMCELKQKVLQQHFEHELAKTGWFRTEDDSSSSDSETEEFKVAKDLAWSFDFMKQERKKESTEPRTKIKDLPPELALKIFGHLGPRQLCQVAQVFKHWNKLALDSSLWKNILPSQWAKDDWSFNDNQTEDDDDEIYHGDEDNVRLDDDADIDETNDDYSALVHQVRREARILSGLSEYILPKVGVHVQKLVLTKCRTLTNGMLQRFLSLCPNVEHLDVSQTQITDAGLRRLGKNGCGSKLKSINLSGCVNLTDATLVRLAMALSSINSCHSNRQEVYTVSPEVEQEVYVTECLCDEYFKIVQKELPDPCRSPCRAAATSDKEKIVECGCFDETEGASCTICDQVDWSNTRPSSCRIESEDVDVARVIDCTDPDSHNRASNSSVQTAEDSCAPDDWSTVEDILLYNCGEAVPCSNVVEVEKQETEVNCDRLGKMFDSSDSGCECGDDKSCDTSLKSHGSDDASTCRNCQLEQEKLGCYQKNDAKHKANPGSYCQDKVKLKPLENTEQKTVVVQKVKLKRSELEQNRNSAHNIPQNESISPPILADTTGCHACCANRSHAEVHEVQSLEECSPYLVGYKSSFSKQDYNCDVGLQKPASAEKKKCCKKWHVPNKDKDLRYLNLSGCYKVTDLGLRALAGVGAFPCLDYLDVSGCFQLSAEGLHDMVAVCPALKADQLYYCDNILDGPFADTASGCRNLQCNSRVCCRSGD